MNVSKEDVVHSLLDNIINAKNGDGMWYFSALMNKIDHCTIAGFITLEENEILSAWAEEERANLTKQG